MPIPYSEVDCVQWSGVHPTASPDEYLVVRMEGFTSTKRDTITSYEPTVHIWASDKSALGLIQHNNDKKSTQMDGFSATKLSEYVEDVVHSAITWDEVADERYMGEGATHQNHRRYTGFTGTLLETINFGFDLYDNSWIAPNYYTLKTNRDVFRHSGFSATVTNFLTITQFPFVGGFQVSAEIAGWAPATSQDFYFADPFFGPPVGFQTQNWTATIRSQMAWVGVTDPAEPSNTWGLAWWNLWETVVDAIKAEFTDVKASVEGGLAMAPSVEATVDVKEGVEAKVDLQASVEGKAEIRESVEMASIEIQPSVEATVSVGY